VLFIHYEWHVFSSHNSNGTCALPTSQTWPHISTGKDRVLRSTKWGKRSPTVW